MFDNMTNAENEFDERRIENAISYLINDNCIDCVDTNENKTYSDVDSSSYSGYEAVVEKWTSLQNLLNANVNLNFGLLQIKFYF